MSAYARTCLEFGAFKLKALLKLAREAPSLPALEQAFASGELPWTKARLLLQVANPDTAADWVARATHISSRELERQVDSVCKGDKPPSPDAVDLAPPRRRRSFLMEATDAEVLDKTLALLRSQTSLRDQDIDDGRLLGLVIRRAAKALADEAEQPPSELHRTVITLCPDCATATHPDFLVMDHVVTQALDDPEILDLTTAQTAASSPGTSRNAPAAQCWPETTTAASSRVARAPCSWICTTSAPSPRAATTASTTWSPSARPTTPPHTTATRACSWTRDG